MTCRSDMYIKDEQLRKDLSLILLTKTRNQVVKDIKSTGVKMHQYNIDRFLSKKPVSIDTLKKIERYVCTEMQLTYNR
jgi:uncharacterized protein involved in tolerance to divalent cations